MKEIKGLLKIAFGLAVGYLILAIFIYTLAFFVVNTGPFLDGLKKSKIGESVDLYNTAKRQFAVRKEWHVSGVFYNAETMTVVADSNKCRVIVNSLNQTEYPYRHFCQELVWP